MGQLSALDVSGHIARYGCRHFVETGTGLGVGLGHAITHPAFQTIQTIEIEYLLYKTSCEFWAKHPDKRVMLHHGQTKDVLPFILSKIPRDEPIMFWLDAHLPGADFDLKSYADEWREDVRLPLKTEMEIIWAYRPLAKDVILCDDARIWLDGDFTLGQLPEHFKSVVPKARTIEPLVQLFRATHDVRVSYTDQGYIELVPKG